MSQYRIRETKDGKYRPEARFLKWFWVGFMSPKQMFVSDVEFDDFGDAVDFIEKVRKLPAKERTVREFK